MSYTELTPEMFQDDANTPSLEYLSQYCQSGAAKKFIYKDRDGIIGWDFPHLIFPNMVKTTLVQTETIAKQFPDLVEVKNIYYAMINTGDEKPNIGKLKSADYFRLYIRNEVDSIEFFKKYVKVIKRNTLMINNKRLTVNIKWWVGNIDDVNYNLHGLAYL